MNVQERPLGALASLLGANEPGAGRGTPPVDIPPALLGSIGADRIRTQGGAQTWFPPQMPVAEPPNAFSTLSGGLGGLLQQIVSLLQQLLSSVGFGGFGGLGGMPAGEQYFNGATASSTGDPHLAFNGNGAFGTQNAKYNSMISHADLLDSDSFSGGYQIGTQVTQPNAKGATWNREASVSTNFGQTSVSLDKDGDATISQFGQTTALQKGQSVDLGNGETVTRNADGSVTIADSNGQGGSITTTLSDGQHGVNVNVQAADVDLGGDLLSGIPFARRGANHGSVTQTHVPEPAAL